ncbi:alcohol dehydrogenase, putative [Talaromyces stipitatus ATCC 10500]|uniref:Alcohol dehydrogenase, putative n=1 Tax=Talaromyces stipitatus (strain ATCC 10500 / CBS 375.48 / QM 6759 / NRRL 1006) TaxID=441959 RepID=B8MU11_TALSN|nr:alcohol dehydrogenase, putative [Talaromyces stipitatus ATCC 10500]EED12644.1 alcohol dehydrogenase, putative [Talaromyces stipitatus ATCC 10500]
MVSNKALIYKKIPTHSPIVGEHLQVESLPDFDSQNVPAGGAAVKGLYFSCDPYMRGRMRVPERTSYAAAYEVGKPITAYALVQVLRLAGDNEESLTTGKGVTIKKGDILYGLFEIAEYSVLSKEWLEHPFVHKIDNPHNLPLSNFLSILGMTGLTAYSSLYEIGNPKKGETIFISSAAGAVGQIVGQIAKREGLRVIGSVGDDAKLDFIVKDLGFDGGFNYKKEASVLEALKRLAPNGVDIYYENVGGEQLAAAIECMNVHGRIGMAFFFSFLFCFAAG